MVAHSKGGLEARYLISSLGMDDKIASLTTISSPHHGSKTMDILFKFPRSLFKFTAVFVNLWLRILGDNQPDFYTACWQFTTYYCNEFNKRNPNSAKVYYQSYATVMRNSLSDIFMAVTHFVISFIEGVSDGMVTPSSAAWTNFRGVLKGVTNRGISHLDSVDFRRHRFTKKTMVDRYLISGIFISVLRQN